MSTENQKDAAMLSFMTLVVEKVVRKWLNTDPPEEPVAVPPAPVVAASSTVEGKAAD